MTAKRSQMWPTRRWGWQRLGTAQQGGRWRGRVPAGPGERGEPPGPAVRGQHWAALGLLEKLRGVGSWGGCASGNLRKPG